MPPPHTYGVISYFHIFETGEEEPNWSLKAVTGAAKSEKRQDSVECYHSIQDIL